MKTNKIYFFLILIVNIYFFKIMPADINSKEKKSWFVEVTERIPIFGNILFFMRKSNEIKKEFSSKIFFLVEVYSFPAKMIKKINDKTQDCLDFLFKLIGLVSGIDFFTSLEEEELREKKNNFLCFIDPGNPNFIEKKIDFKWGASEEYNLLELPAVSEESEKKEDSIYIFKRNIFLLPYISFKKPIIKVNKKNKSSQGKSNLDVVDKKNKIKEAKENEREEDKKKDERKKTENNRNYRPSRKQTIKELGYILQETEKETLQKKCFLKLIGVSMDNFNNIKDSNEKLSQVINKKNSIFWPFIINFLKEKNNKDKKREEQLPKADNIFLEIKKNRPKDFGIGSIKTSSSSKSTKRIYSNKKLYEKNEFSNYVSKKQKNSGNPFFNPMIFLFKRAKAVV